MRRDNKMARMSELLTEIHRSRQNGISCLERASQFLTFDMKASALKSNPTLHLQPNKNLA